MAGSKTRDDDRERDQRQRDVILRRRARFIASAVGLTLGAPIVTARADDEQLAPPSKQNDSVALAPGPNAARCVSVNDVSVEVAHEVREAIDRARVLHDTKQHDEARAEIERARGLALLPEVLELDAMLLARDGRLAAARAALEARQQCDAPMSEATTRELTSLRERTATITIGSSGAIAIDGVRVAPHGPVEIYVDVGSHELEIQTFGGDVVTRTLAFAGGESEAIEVDNSEPHVCLSVCLSPPWRDRRESGPLGITLGPTALFDVAGGDQRTSANPFGLGATIAPFLRTSGGEWTDLRAGVIASPSASSRGFAMPLGGFASARLVTSSLAVGLGVSSGYLIAPRPSRSAAGLFDPASSFFIEPNIPLAIRIGPFEIEHRLGVMWSGQQDAVRSRFAPTYVTLTIGFTWLPTKGREDEMASSPARFHARAPPWIERRR